MLRRRLLTAKVLDREWTEPRHLAYINANSSKTPGVLNREMNFYYWSQADGYTIRSMSDADGNPLGYSEYFYERTPYTVAENVYKNQRKDLPLHSYDLYIRAVGHYCKYRITLENGSVINDELNGIGNGGVEVRKDYNYSTGLRSYIVRVDILDCYREDNSTGYNGDVRIYANQGVTDAF